MSTPILMRPTISALTLCNGERALRVTAANRSVLITERHIAGFLDDLDQFIDGEDDHIVQR